MGKRSRQRNSAPQRRAAADPAGEPEQLRARQVQSVASEFEQCKRLHDWGDPFLGAWKAYALARDNGVDVPDWVATYLLRVARRFSDISRDAQREVQSGKTVEPSDRAFALKVVRALEIITRRGPSVFFRRAVAWRDLALAEEVWRRVRGKMQVKEAIFEVAKDRGVKRDTVQLAWRRLRPWLESREASWKKIEAES